jgi:hypothetical protein
VVEALWIWRQFPRQIARDLHRFHGLKIADWHRGTRGADGHLVLSSYELLTYLEYLDEESAFKTDAERGGRQPIKWQMLAEQVNEAYRFRSSWQAAHSENGEAFFDTTDIEFVDPVDRVARAKREAEKQQAVQQAVATFEVAIGFRRPKVG